MYALKEMVHDNGFNDELRYELEEEMYETGLVEQVDVHNNNNKI